MRCIKWQNYTDKTAEITFLYDSFISVAATKIVGAQVPAADDGGIIISRNLELQ